MSKNGASYDFTDETRKKEEMRDDILKEVKHTKNKKVLQITQFLFANNMQHLHTVQEADNTFLFILKSGKVYHINEIDNILNIGIMPVDKEGNIDFQTLRIDAYIQLEHLDNVKRIAELLKD